MLDIRLLFGSVDDGSKVAECDMDRAAKLDLGSFPVGAERSVRLQASSSESEDSPSASLYDARRGIGRRDPRGGVLGTVIDERARCRARRRV